MIQERDTAREYPLAEDLPPELEYLPARMINEFVYCPRLFFLEHVEGVFAHNADTIDGEQKHRRVDAVTKELPSVRRRASSASAASTGTSESGEAESDPVALEFPTIHARSVTLASDTHRVLAKLDLVEAHGLTATPIDYKRGSPRIAEDGTPTAWEPDQVQICVQALVLRDNGYTCSEGIIYFAETKQRITIPITPQLEAQTLDAIAQARRVMASQWMPPPLVASPKCPRCSLVGICLPDESVACQNPLVEAGTQGYLFDPGPRLYQISNAEVPAEPPNLRRLFPSRDDRRPLYVNTPGATLGKSGEVLEVKEKGKKILEARMRDTSQVNLLGPVQVSTQCLQSLLQAEIPVAFFSMGHWFYGMTNGIGLKNIMTRRQQFRKADDPRFCLQLARALVAGKIHNSRVMLMRNHIAPPAEDLRELKRLEERTLQCPALDSLLGLEGTAAAIYFSLFSGMIKVGNAADPFAPPEELAAGPPLPFDFRKRNRRPPRDPVNALLSFAYSLLTKELTITCSMVGLDPFLGYYHQPRFGRPALALDLMEPFRPLIADSAVLTAINSRMVQAEHFIQAGDAVALTPVGRKNFLTAFEQRMDNLVTHPIFGYRLSYRRLLEVQTRLLARLLTEELGHYPVFVTR